MFSTISIILCVVDVPLYAFHLSMIVFFVTQIVRGVEQFKQGFFVVYLAVSVADCLYIAYVNKHTCTLTYTIGGWVRQTFAFFPLVP